jgi:hypothetical protein
MHLWESLAKNADSAQEQILSDLPADFNTPANNGGLDNI